MYLKLLHRPFLQKGRGVTLCVPGLKPCATHRKCLRHFHGEARIAFANYDMPEAFGDICFGKINLGGLGSCPGVV